MRRLSVMSMINSGSAYHIPAADGLQASYGDYHSLLWNIMSREHAYIYIYMMYLFNMVIAHDFHIIAMTHPIRRIVHNSATVQKVKSTIIG